MKNFHFTPGLMLLVMIVTSSTKTAHAGDPIYMGQQAAGPVSFDRVDHSPWDTLLKKYVDTDGYVDYQAWHGSTADSRALQAYLGSLSQANPQAQSSKEATLAFWINAYNAVTIYGILREYPTTSIRNHTAKLVGYNIWKDLQLFVGGRPWSLDAMEHQVLRKMGEPRIHFAIVCASIGCPRLLNQAYTAEKLEQQLATNTSDFFSRPQNFRVSGSTLHVSSIMDWFGTDFGPTPQAQFTRLKNYLPENAQQLATSPKVRIAWQEYNWSLNDQRTAYRGASARSAKPSR